MDPDQAYSVADYQAAGEAALAEVAARARVALLVGGSPHYIQAVVDRLALPRVAPRPALRAELEALAASEGPLAVWERLRRLDGEGAARADRYNVRRLIRAIEVVTATGEPLSGCGAAQGGGAAGAAPGADGAAGGPVRADRRADRRDAGRGVAGRGRGSAGTGVCAGAAEPVGDGLSRAEPGGAGEDRAGRGDDADPAPDA